ncbi:MAG TPA: hypothetical protein VMZ53_06690 [Kofleriaceae bacterium]|nr:hypothetical protein [Kofleriaceae bacterium]
MATAATAIFTACDVGSVVQNSTGTDGGTKMDGTGSGSGSGSGSAANCEEISATPPDGHHNPGQNCIAAGCHLTGQLGTNAPPFTYAGTLYTTAAGTAPVAGATIFVKMGATEKKVLSANNGNFWMGPAPAGINAPTNAMTATTKASGCALAPNHVPMVGALVQGGGNCNNCHRNGGTTTPIHLP